MGQKIETPSIGQIAEQFQSTGESTLESSNFLHWIMTGQTSQIKGVHMRRIIDFLIRLSVKKEEGVGVTEPKMPARGFTSPEAKKLFECYQAFMRAAHEDDIGEDGWPAQLVRFLVIAGRPPVAVSKIVQDYFKKERGEIRSAFNTELSRYENVERPFALDS